MSDYNDIERREQALAKMNERKEVTPQDLRNCLMTLYCYRSDNNTIQDESEIEARRDAELAAFDRLAQDAENWDCINPDGDAQVLVPKAAFDAMAEKAAKPRFEQFTRGQLEVLRRATRTFHKSDFGNTGDENYLAYELEKEINEALKAVTE